MAAINCAGLMYLQPKARFLSYWPWSSILLKPVGVTCNWKREFIFFRVYGFVLWSVMKKHTSGSSPCIFQCFWFPGKLCYEGRGASVFGRKYHFSFPFFSFISFISRRKVLVFLSFYFPSNQTRQHFKFPFPPSKQTVSFWRLRTS